MQIDNMVVAVRPMSTSQAIDLGFMMARHWFLPLWQLWLGMALPMFLLCVICALGTEYMFVVNDNTFTSNNYWYADLGFFIVFLCKPLYEQVMYLWLGDALFSQQVTVKSVLKNSYRQYFQNFGKLIFRYRLSPTRQIIIPILMLEKPSSSQLKNRIKIIHRGQSGVMWFTIIMIHLEIVLMLGILTLLVLMIPHDIFIPLFDSYGENMEAEWYILSRLLYYSSYFFVASIIAPFFICAGFSVYLTKRCLLEGWDIELVFKQLANRYDKTTRNHFMVDNAQSSLPQTSLPQKEDV